jgi:hypothetical protein
LSGRWQGESWRAPMDCLQLGKVFLRPAWLDFGRRDFNNTFAF